MIDELDGGQQLDRLAALDFNKLASAIHTPIPIFGARHRAFLICTDHDTVGLLLQTPSDDPSDRGETVRFAVSKFHQLYKAMPVGFQNILDGFLVAQGLLPPFEAKYL